MKIQNNTTEGSTPGTPINWNEPSNPGDPQAGYGYIANDTTTEETFFFHSDHLGSTSYITDDKGNITQYDAYLPYGELLVDEHSSSEEMPYKFNGKEFDEETGLYYYGARYLDPRLSLWMSTDPMKEKYPKVATYCFVNNNPLAYIDVNGKDGIRIIDNENKTITIKADYFIVTGVQKYRKNKIINDLAGYSSKDIEKFKNYNEYLNNLKLTVPSGYYKGYSVIFDLSFIDAGSVYDAMSKASEDMYEGTPIGNTIQLGNEYTHRNLNFQTIYYEDGSTATVGGVTDKNKNIVMNNTHDTKMNRIHEIFHTFGFSHPKGSGGEQGIMRYPPSKLDALELSTTLFLPTINKE